MNVLITELESEICSVGGPLQSSLTPGRVTQLFTENTNPVNVLNPPCPGGHENKRRLKRKKSSFYPQPHSSGLVKASASSVKWVRIHLW